MRKVLIIPDTHSKNYDQKAWNAMLSYASKHEITDVVHLGDLIEGDSVSAHNKGKPKLLEGERLSEDYEFAGRLLDEIRDAVGAVASMTLLAGNHEWRVGRYLQEHPELEGLLEVETGLELKRRKVRYVESYPHGELFNIGKLYFHHGLYVGGNHAKKHVDTFGVSVAYGHTHEVAIHTKVTLGKGKALAAYNLGCLCRYDMPYLEGRPTNWQHAFGTAYIQDNGMFNLTIHNIFSGELVVNGEKYSYRDRLPKKGMRLPKSGKRK